MTIAWRWAATAGRNASCAIEAIEVAGSDDALRSACARLAGLSLPEPGTLRHVSLPGPDDGLAIRPSERLLLLFPHGGRALRQVQDAALCQAWGPPRAEPSAATSRATLMERFPEARSVVEACALDLLADAEGTHAVACLLRQHDRWSRPVEGDRSESGELPSSVERSLRHLLHPPIVVVAGPANAGKSSLVNALAGRDVSVVDARAGTTRDHVGVSVAVDGLRVTLVDLPGVRADADPIEREAARLAEGVLRHASLVLLAHAPGQQPIMLDPSRIPAAGVMSVLLQSDRLPALGPSASGILAVSARTGEGLDSLARAIRARLVPDAALRDERPWRFHPALDGLASPLTERGVTAP